MSDILWAGAAPFWAENNGNDLSGINRPTILRFANDSFMDEFANILANQPGRLADYRAWPETWQNPLPQPAPVASLPPALREFQRKRLGGPGAPPASKTVDHPDASKPLKLYQPAHQRYYLLTSSLICRQVGLPDHAVNSSAQEKAAFVLRRLMLAQPESFANSSPPAPDLAPPGVYDEFAFVDGEWRKAVTEKSLVVGEELNPLFAVCYTQTDGRRRRMFGGLIPVGRREAYMTAKKGTGSEPATGGVDPRLEMQLERVFFGPWDNLIDSTIDLVCKMNTDLANAKIVEENDVKKKRWQIQEASWYLLLDLADFLGQHMKPVLDAFESKADTTGAPALDKVLKTLKQIVLPKEMKDAIEKSETPKPSVIGSLGEALSKIQAYRQQLEGSVEPYAGSGLGTLWPNFLFPLVDLDFQVVSSKTRVGLNMPRKSTNDAKPEEFNTAYEIVVEKLSDAPAERRVLRAIFETEVQTLLKELRAALLAALPAQSALRLPPVPLAAQISKTSASTPITETGWFVARCVLERPNCFPLPDSLVSDPTPAFQLAAFFDPDAPARPIRIALPVDTSPAGLRKFDKNTAFIMSDILCGQVNRAKSMGLIDLIRSVLPFPLHKDLEMDTAPCKEGDDALGTICSLSIPIVTICALILLIIIVKLLDVIFHWVPFLMMCFPLKKFSAKKAGA